MKRTLILASMIVLLFQWGCASTQVSVGNAPAPRPVEARHKGHGPPPHAPAHGYRHKHGGGVELEYDQGLSAYVVVGYDDHFYLDELFLRYREGAWQVSVAIGEGWRAPRKGEVPHKLAKKYAKKGRGRGKAKGKK